MRGTARSEKCDRGDERRAQPGGQQRGRTWGKGAGADHRDVGQSDGEVGLFGEPFFFSSRRRHTRFDCDWSSDVCSSDLVVSIHAGRSRGTGFYFKPGYVLTNVHVIEGSSTVEVSAGDTKRTARVVSTSREIGRASCRERV